MSNPLPVFYKPSELIRLPSLTLFFGLLLSLSRGKVGICLYLPQKIAPLPQSLHLSNGVPTNQQASLGWYHPSPNYYRTTHEEDTPTWGIKNSLISFGIISPSRETFNK